MDEVRPEAQVILERYGIDGSRAVTVLSHAWVVTARSEGNRASKRRQFLAAVEYACQELRAQLGPPGEEVEDERVH
jgi:antitoxin component of RelBE/YafQ-DinJ toxin-antitoxin module